MSDYIYVQKSNWDEPEHSVEPPRNEPKKTVGFPSPYECYVPEVQAQDDMMVGYNRGPLKGIPIEKRHRYKKFDIDTGEEVPIDWESEENDPREPFKPNNYVQIFPKEGDKTL